MLYKARTNSDIEKAFHYAKRLLETAKFGILINISEKRQKRSTKQNRYYRGVIVATIGKNEGYHKHEYEIVHEALRDMFCPVKKIIFGVGIKSTTLLNTAEMEQYHEDIRAWYYDFGSYQLPLPNEVPDDFEEEEN